ncbi:GNAT family N-acetyltransferase [Micromonospora sp. R77]|uniref:GNAT family N-acetyltransferase n=1 Tax=Micromonospora sp. R77 TaxID=2925836 RepID=UPI001F624A89|nr:GNAT family N-acetyltransferase [Micromonospora sp. R77]MCI4066853.1 GNAT family N-acetyltransferase [Micromonospora sp. R77]
MAEVTCFRVATSPADRDAVRRLREAVYVQDQSRLVDVADTAATFDRFDGHATYLLAEDGTEAVGTIKVVPDGEIGLPCDDVVDLAFLRRPGNRLVEFGHLMTLPRIRQQSVGMALMRAALVHSVARHRATHVLGDFFADDTGGLRPFYLQVGFVAVGEPYPDERFHNAPLSVVGVLDVEAAARRCRAPENRDNRVLQYFFADYDGYAATAAA